MEAQRPPPHPRHRTLVVLLASVAVADVALVTAVFAFFVAPEIPVAAHPLVVGLILSETGVLASFGDAEQQGITLAAEEINDAGGVLGRPIYLRFEDDESSIGEARLAAERLLSDPDVAVILGPTGNGPCFAALEVATAHHVPMVSPSCTSPPFTQLVGNGSPFARTVPSDALQGAVAAHHARTARGFARMAIIATDDNYGHGIADAFERHFVIFGGTVTTREFVPTQPPAYESALNGVFSTNPEAIYVATYAPDAAGYFATAYRTPVWRNAFAWLFAEGAFDQIRFVDALVGGGIPPEALQRIEGIAPAAYAGVHPAPGYSSWASRFEARWGQPPDVFAANAYDAAYLVALAAQTSRSPTADGIRSALFEVANPPGVLVGPGDWTEALAALKAGQDVDYEGASGSVDLDANGDPPGAYVLWTVDANFRLTTTTVYGEDLTHGLRSSAPALVPSAEPVRGSEREPVPTAPRAHVRLGSVA